MAERVYITEDDDSIRELVTVALSAYSYEVESFVSAEDSLAATEKQVPDIFLFDIMLPGMDGVQAVKILRGLKLDNDTIGNVKSMVMAFQTPLAVDKIQIRKLLSRVTEYQFLGAMQLKKLDGDETVPELLRLFEEIREAGDCVSLKQLAVNGGDLLQQGLEKGKQIGDGLMYLLNLVLEEPELNKKDILLEKINQFKEI